MKTALQILEGALTRLRRDGWCQHEPMDCDGRMCITGSMEAELGLLRLGEYGLYERTPLQTLSPKQLDALRAAGRICMQLLSVDGPAWNNAPERTFADIEALFTAAIAIAAEHEGEAVQSLSLLAVGLE